ncbi:MAG: hypothetical protein GX593_00140 [Actinomycetales bacterium]|nr:hypothetical protein [Actinomycetales bacterium]
MPDLVGLVLQDAQNSLQALGSRSLDQQDASGQDRMQINDSNWTVCTQEPAAGAEIPLSATVILASVKLDEVCPGGAVPSPEETTVHAAPEPEPAPSPDTSTSPAEPDEAEETDDPEEPGAPDLTVSQEQAVRSAESYLRYSAFSKKGLIDQLEYEGFLIEDASFAVEHIDVDWKAQALSSAESYLRFSAFSKKGLIDQLVYEGFTKKQAEHGVEHVEVDWMEQAALSAESYLKFSAFSRSGLIDQLVYEGFTKKQAEHGADAVGL